MTNPEDTIPQQHALSSVSPLKRGPWALYQAPDSAVEADVNRAREVVSGALSSKLEAMPCLTFSVDNHPCL